MLLHPRMPLIVGTGALGFLLLIVFDRASMPAPLSDTHAGLIPGLPDQEGCHTCHQGQGVNEGCMSCHEEILGQLHEGRGYHYYLSEQEVFRCQDCHQEHHGETFPLIHEGSWEPEAQGTFSHPHVEFVLTGGHEALECSKCHEEQRDEPFALPSFPDRIRKDTFLGLEQTCSRCHDDPHADGLVQDCGQCHGQEEFHPPAFFQHEEHFPLAGGHDELACSECHSFAAPEAPRAEHPFPFDDVTGTTCAECHETPHQIDFPESCDACHQVAEPLWLRGQDAMTAERHAFTGFPLDAPHAELDCSECHQPDLSFTERHPDPTAPDYLRQPESCQGCHADVHEGQFEGRFDRCLDCHDTLFFRPTTFDQARHASHFALTGAHEATACIECHQVDTSTAIRRFAGTEQSCKGCHADPHARQFQDTLDEGDCSTCHRDVADTFSLRPFDHTTWTGVTLTGAHVKADCAGCHKEEQMPVGDHTVLARRYVGTPESCASCHDDVHRGQFEAWESCESCHTSSATWSALDFNHDKDSRFPLEGAHREASCSACHKPTLEKDGLEVVRYRPMGMECRDCHDSDPRIKKRR